jgi:hypothetical protein
MVYMLEKTMQNCTNCEKRMASACNWNFISIQPAPLSELATLVLSSKERKFGSGLSQEYCTLFSVEVCKACVISDASICANHSVLSGGASISSMLPCIACGFS